mgnify:CR=1 FL=1
MKYAIPGIALMAALAVLASMVPATQAAEQEYLGMTACKMCHKDQYAVWETKAHKKAFELLKSPESVAIGKEKGLATPPSEAPECLVCHVTSYDAKTKKIHAKIKMKDGVSCESCHVASKDHQKFGMATRMKKDTSGMEKGVRKGTKEDCEKCHNEKSPSWNPERYTLEDGTKTGFDFKQAYKKIEHPLKK